MTLELWRVSGDYKKAQRLNKGHWEDKAVCLVTKRKDVILLGGDFGKKQPPGWEGFCKTKLVFDYYLVGSR